MFSTAVHDSWIYTLRRKQGSDGLLDLFASGRDQDGEPLRRLATVPEEGGHHHGPSHLAPCLLDAEGVRLWIGEAWILLPWLEGQ